MRGANRMCLQTCTIEWFLHARTRAHYDCEMRGSVYVVRRSAWLMKYTRCESSNAQSHPSGNGSSAASAPAYTATRSERYLAMRAAATHTATGRTRVVIHSSGNRCGYRVLVRSRRSDCWRGDGGRGRGSTSGVVLLRGHGGAGGCCPVLRFHVQHVPRCCTHAHPHTHIHSHTQQRGNLCTRSLSPVPRFMSSHASTTMSDGNPPSFR